MPIRQRDAKLHDAIVTTMSWKRGDGLAGPHATNMRYLFVRLAAWGLLLQLPGCGIAPQRDVDKPIRFNSARTPYAAAICIARNARGGADGLQADERTLDASAWEVVVRARGTTLAVAEVRGEGVGSAVSIRVAESVSTGREDFARRLMSGC